MDVRGWVVGLGLVFAACGTSPSGALGVDGAVDPERDAGTRDATPGTMDAATPDATEPAAVDCEAWCRLDLDCRIEELAQRDVFGSALSCHYPAPDDALTRCVDECEGRGTRLPPGISDECLVCEAGNIRFSCTPDRRWRNCRPVCGEYDLRFVRHALLDALTCAPEGTPAESPLCTGTGDGLRIVASTSSRELEVRNTATVVGRDPLRFGLADGIEVQVAAYGSVVLPALSLGESVELDVKIDCPFWCEARVTVRGAGGGLVFAAWHGNRWMVPALPEVTIDYLASDCAWARRECYGVLSGDLVATPPGGSPLRVRPQSTATLDGLRIHHVAAEVYFEHACTDTPWEHTTGLVSGR